MCSPCANSVTINMADNWAKLKETRVRLEKLWVKDIDWTLYPETLCQVSDINVHYGDPMKVGVRVDLMKVGVVGIGVGVGYMKVGAVGVGVLVPWSIGGGNARPKIWTGNN